MALPHHPCLLRETRRNWPLMPACQRFEQGVAFLPALVAAPAGATLVLGLVYWLLRERGPGWARA